MSDIDKDKIEERYPLVQLTEEQKALQARTIDLVYDLLVACMMELQDSGTGSQVAASFSINAGVRGLLLYASTIYGYGKDVTDHEVMANARKEAYTFVSNALAHVQSQADDHHKGSLN
jgi:hypothetical protein